MYKINTLFSISNYLLAINRTQQLSQIEAKKKKKSTLEQGSLKCLERPQYRERKIETKAVQRSIVPTVCFSLVNSGRGTTLVWQTDYFVHFKCGKREIW